MLIKLREDLTDLELEQATTASTYTHDISSKSVINIPTTEFIGDSITDILGVPKHFFTRTSVILHVHDGRTCVLTASSNVQGTVWEDSSAYVPVIKKYWLRSLDPEDNLNSSPTTYPHSIIRTIGAFSTEVEVLPDNILNRDFTVLLDENMLYATHVHLPEYGIDIRTNLLIEATATDTRRDALIWTESQHADIEVNSDGIREELRVRYAFFQPPKSGLLNVVLDSFVPQLMYKANLNPNRINRIFIVPKTAVAISPWFAAILGVKQMPIIDILAILGYTVQDMRKLFKQVRAKKMDMVMIGYGGTSVNTITWLSEIAKAVNGTQIFQSIKIFENDVLEVSNLFRFPLDPRQNIHEYNADTTHVSKLHLVDRGINRLTADMQTHNRYFDPKCAVHSSNTVFYGAPDIATREALSKIGNFISATHSDQSCRIDLNPAQNVALQVESYGVISLATFFMNQVRLAIGLLELLASDQSLTEFDKTILEFTFDGKAKLPASRHYNFQMEHTGMIMTPEEAQGTNNV